MAAWSRRVQRFPLPLELLCSESEYISSLGDNHTTSYVKFGCASSPIVYLNAFDLTSAEVVTAYGQTFRSCGPGPPVARVGLVKRDGVSHACCAARGSPCFPE